MLILRVSASKSKPKRKSVGWNICFLTSWWTQNGRLQVAIRIVSEITFLIPTVNGMHVSCVLAERKGRKDLQLSNHFANFAQQYCRVIWKLHSDASWNEVCGFVFFFFFFWNETWLQGDLEALPGYCSDFMSVPSFKEETNQLKLWLQKSNQTAAFL